MNRALTLAAITEAGTGVALFMVPSLVVRLLFGEEATGVALLIARVTGIALVGLAVACWPDRSSLRTVQGMLTYDLLSMLYLIYVAVNGVAGSLLWPVIVIHAGLSVLLIRTLLKERRALGANR